jgi:DNA-directed RNA polymerase specialized sigma24 family protein
VAEREPGPPGLPAQRPPDYCLPGDRPEEQSGARGSPGHGRMAEMRGEFISFYDQEHLLLVRFLMNAGASLPAAEDAMQEAFADAWALVQSGNWERVENPAGWIRVVGLRKYYRQRDRAGRELPVPDFAVAPSPAPCPADLAGEARSVLAALHSLPADERVALAFQIDGFSCRETADHLRITEQKTRDLRKKARRNLASQRDDTLARRRTQ